MSRYVTVPQDDGEVTVTVGNGEPRTYRVDQGVVTARTIEEEQHLLLFVDGAKRATKSRVAKVKGPAAADEQDATVPDPDTTTQADPSGPPARHAISQPSVSPAPLGSAASGTSGTAAGSPSA